MNRNQKQRIVLPCFLLAEAVLYALILTSRGQLLVWSSYLSIVLCFLYALLGGKQRDWFLVGGLTCTVLADFFLIVCTPIQQLWGMVCFLAAQLLYAIRLQRLRKNTGLLLARIGLTVLAEIAALVVLRDKADALAMVSMGYYANLIINIVEAFTHFSNHKLLPVGFVLFALCDTVIGLQVVSAAYLPIPESSVLYKILFMDFNLSWFFYLPSQILIASSSRKKIP